MRRRKGGRDTILCGAVTIGTGGNQSSTTDTTLENGPDPRFHLLLFLQFPPLNKLKQIGFKFLEINKCDFIGTLLLLPLLLLSCCLSSLLCFY